MNFATLCKFYVANYAKLKNNKLVQQYLISSYELLQIKRNKLKLGAVIFEIQPLIINGLTVTYSFEMIFSRQPSSNTSKKTMEKILTFFK